MDTDLDGWIADLQHADDVVVDELEQIVSKGALNVKRAWRGRWEGHPHIPELPRAITYDLHRDGATVAAEIGPDKLLPQGPLGNLIEFGSIHNAPIPGGVPALDAEAPRFERATADLAERLLDG